MKKIIKIIFILICLQLAVLSFNKSYATQVEGSDATGSTSKSTQKQEQKQEETKTDGMTDIFSDARKFVNRGRSNQNDFDIASFKINIDTIYTILLTVGIALTVIIGGILGIKFMMASAEDKAKIKEAMIPYVIGCIVIYGAFFIWKTVIIVLGDL